MKASCLRSASLTVSRIFNAAVFLDKKSTSGNTEDSIIAFTVSFSKNRIVVDPPNLK